MKASAVLALLPLVVAAPAKRDSPAPLIVPRGVQVVEGKYIVKFKDEFKAQHVESAVTSISADAEHLFSELFNGFAASLTPQEVENLRHDPSVDFVEQDAIMTISVSQSNADWGLARLSSQTPGTTTYSYDGSAGAGTCAFIIDTGIEAAHPDFGGRASFLKNFADNTNSDGHGHGTHVAGTIGGNTYGVSKKTKLYSVKVLDSRGSGTNSGVIAGMDYVAKTAKTYHCPKGVVVNMSLGGGRSESVNQAANGIAKAGLFLAVAAGNSNDDANSYSPASASGACTVGATTKTDELASYSNYGPKVNVLAPGSNILSAWIGKTTKSISGTSMASPHVAGIAAYFLGLGVSVNGLCDYIASKGVQGAIANVPDDTANILINNGYNN